MRVTWNGSLSFGLVSIPVGLAPATKPAARQSDVSFRLLHREDLTPIKQKRWCPTHDREVGADELVKGWEFAKGQFVVVEEAELEALERRDDSRTIDIERFVPLAEIDPVWHGPHVLPRPRRRRRAAKAVQAASRGDGGGRRRRDRAVRPLRARVDLPRPAQRPGPRARDHVPRRGRLLAGRDRRGDGRDRREEAGARPRAPDRRWPLGRVRPGRAVEHVPRRPPRPARGEAPRRGDRRAGADPRACARRRPASRRSRRASRRRRAPPAAQRGDGKAKSRPEKKPARSRAARR